MGASLPLQLGPPALSVTRVNRSVEPRLGPGGTVSRGVARRPTRLPRRHWSSHHLMTRFTKAEVVGAHSVFRGERLLWCTET